MDAIPSRPRPDGYDAVRVLAIVILGLYALGAGLAQLRAPDWAAAGAVEALFVLVPVGYALATGIRIRSAFPLRLPDPKTMIFIVSASLGTMWLLHGAMLLQEWIYHLLGQRETVRQAYEQMDREVRVVRDRGMLPALLLLSCVPAFCEEVLFRGFLLTGFSNGFSRGRALLYTTLLFAAMHVQMLKIPLMILLGLFFGVLVLLTRSLWTGVLAHFFNNAAAVFVSGLESRGFTIGAAPWWLYLVSAVVLAGSLWVLRSERTK